jgi:glutathione S-transferase
VARVTLIFYAQPVSNYCAKVEVALRAKGVAFEERAPPGGYGSATYKAIVAAGTIPAIVDGDLVLSESETINEYLEEAFAGPALLPGDARERARLRMLARFHDNRLEPPIRALFGQMAPAGRDPAAAGARVKEIHARLEDLARMAAPAPFLGGPTFTLADCPYPATLMLAEKMLAVLGEPLGLPDRLAPWRRMLETHPAVAPVLARAAEATEAWLRSKGV